MKAQAQLEAQLEAQLLVQRVQQVQDSLGHLACPLRLPAPEGQEVPGDQEDQEDQEAREDQLRLNRYHLHRGQP